MGLKLTEKKTRILCENDVIKAVDKHTNEGGTLDNDISCILEEVNAVNIIGSKEGMENMKVERSLPKTQCNIPMPSVKPPSSNGDRICDTCNKEDVCMYKGECAQAAKDISLIAERKNVFIDTDIRCKKLSGKISNYRGLDTKFQQKG